MSPRSTARKASPIRRALLVLLATAVVTGAASLVATLLAPAAQQLVVAYGAGTAALLLSVASAAAAYWQLAARRARERTAALEAEVQRMADETLPALVGRLREGASPDTALAEIDLPEDGPRQRILRTAAVEIGTGERMRAATMGACANAAGRVQAMATSMLADLREMQHRHDDEEVLGDLLRIDHSIAQAGRLADSIAVLTGSRSGRRWTKPIVMESILRGAVGRIRDYPRVQLHSASTAAIAGYAAEGVMHALAELMDNAASFSPPSENVHVYVEDGQAGIAVTIEDGGLVMKPAALRRAERAVSSEPLDLTTLSGTRLGLAVVGCLARKHGLTVSFRPSARGGTGVVVLIPRELVTEAWPAPEPRARRAGARSAPEPESQAGSASGPSPQAGSASGSEAVRTASGREAVGSASEPASQTRSTPELEAARTASGPEAARSTSEPAPQADSTSEPASQPRPADAPFELPRRRRGQTLAAAPKQPERPASKPRPDTAARFTAFRQARTGQILDSDQHEDR
ncbi:sensor histidine kinase [Saccharopolyspora taberi]|uniref:histidine kinase n=1 Tax=Saccharopolyspora taberi TaxID=60895 RepID=A0ABN3V829_9PSEU